MSLNSKMNPTHIMSKIKQIDDLTPDEIKDVDEFYASEDNKKTFKTSDEFIKWLNE